VSARASLESWESWDAQYFAWKRIVDVAVAATLLVVLSPLMLLAALAVCLDSPGPALFRQRRVGENGEEFDMLKFRSMRHNASSQKHEEAVKAYIAGEKLNMASDTDAPYKLANDLRITRVGAFIRKTSIDELPQLWNVLIGHMSMVGPRPPTPYEVTIYSPRAMERLNGKPGITGPWQVFGRNRVTFAEMIEMDVAYLRERSILYDLRLMALTLPAAVHGA
jgi:lipopolysaccharide/colanic/teichoic acid biosynthesis glycosyltransferase